VYIFYCAGGKFGVVAGVFLTKKHSPDAGSEAPDAVSERPVCRLPGSARVRHRTLAGASDALSPVSARFANLSGCESGEHRTVRCSASGDLHVFADLSEFRTGVHRTRPVPSCSASGALQVTVRL